MIIGIYSQFTMTLNNVKDVINKMKALAREIAEEESRKYGININVCPMTIVEYYNSEIFKKNLFLSGISKLISGDISSLTVPFKCDVFCQTGEGNIVAFIKYISKMQSLSSETILPDFIFSIYSELRYQYENMEKPEELTYEKFVLNVEKCISNFDNSVNQSKLFSEISADLYGINMTIEYLEKNNQLSETFKNYLESRKKVYEYNFACYNFQWNFKRFNQIIIQNDLEQIQSFCNWFAIFYNEDKTFKNLNQILSNSNIKLIDNKVLVAILSSEDFLKSINFQELSNEYQCIIMEALKNAYHSELIKRKHNDNFYNHNLIDVKSWISLNIITFNNISYYLNTISKFLEIMHKSDMNIDFLANYCESLNNFFEEDKLNSKTR